MSGTVLPLYVLKPRKMTSSNFTFQLLGSEVLVWYDLAQDSVVTAFFEHCTELSRSVQDVAFVDWL
jgi:hypothetical protein